MGGQSQPTTTDIYAPYRTIGVCNRDTGGTFNAGGQGPCTNSSCFAVCCTCGAWCFTPVQQKSRLQSLPKALVNDGRIGWQVFSPNLKNMLVFSNGRC
ncbi:hypothetical protein DPMN_156670 [Dreissena polymorpha]|uniref:Uncharacterized protein n=1 Tax=Dreissena polymorpha TaxID=45954 RepID=A0A9D4JCK5_DREPO|nr:hypothetical protein DPMN_156670 [Dreissena polymorpha]